LIMGHGRRQVIWFGVTTHPTAEWIANQITEACGWEQLPRYLIRDRDGAYGEVFIRRLRSMGIRDQPTSPRSPWQNGYAERLIGSIRRECLDHVVVLGECHLRHLLLSYMKYYNAPARIYPWRRMRRSRVPSNGPGRFFAAQFSAGCTTNMSGFDFRQAQVRTQAKRSSQTRPLQLSALRASSLPDIGCRC
jgi:transposase InsO family protein